MTDSTDPGGPVFIVGASRSGTALVRSVLNNHPAIHVAGETHYFDDLRPRMQGRERQLVEPADVARCEDYFLALSHRPYGHQGDAAQATMSRDRLRTEAERLGGGADGYFQAYCRMSAEVDGKAAAIWGEKTPRHVYRIPEIVDRFPDGRVVAMVRDPRAVVASYRDWRSQGGFDLDADPGHEGALAADERRAQLSYNIVMQSLLWRSTVNAALEARERFGDERVHLVRYEDLVEEPRRVVDELCGWLGIDATPELLDVPVHNSSFTRFDRQGGFQKDAKDRWRQKLTAREVAVIQSTCRGTMRDAGYRPIPAQHPWWAVPAAYLSLVPTAIRATLANRQRIANLPGYIWRRLRLLRR